MFCSASVMATASTSAFVVLIVFVALPRGCSRALVLASSSRTVRIFVMVEGCTAYCALLVAPVAFRSARAWLHCSFLLTALLHSANASVVFATSRLQVKDMYCDASNAACSGLRR